MDNQPNGKYESYLGMSHHPNLEIEKWEFDLEGKTVLNVSLNTELIPDTDYRDYWEINELLPISDQYNC